MPDPVLERIYPDTPGDERDEDIIRLHIERYRFAGENLKKGVIADISCGAGYGSFLLATEYQSSITNIFSVDISNEAIEYAKNQYAHPLIEFMLHDGISFQAATRLDTIVSLETIEHLSDPERFVKNFVSQLKPGGRFIASAPVTPSMDANPYHLQDFTVKRFKKLFLDEELVEITSQMQIQKFSPFKLLKKRNGRTKELRRNLPLYYLKHPKKLFLRLSSLIRDGFCNKYLLVVFEKK